MVQVGAERCGERVNRLRSLLEVVRKPPSEVVGYGSMAIPVEREHGRLKIQSLAEVRNGVAWPAGVLEQCNARQLSEPPEQAPEKRPLSRLARS